MVIPGTYLNVANRSKLKASPAHSTRGVGWRLSHRPIRKLMTVEARSTARNHAPQVRYSA